MVKERLEPGREISGFRYCAANMDGRESKDPGSNPAHLAINSRTEDLPLSIQY